MTGVPSPNITISGYDTQYGAGMMTSSPGFSVASIALKMICLPPEVTTVWRRLVVEAVVALHLGDDRLAQRRRAGHGGVLGVVVADRRDRRFLDVVRRRHVGLAGGEADDVFARRFHLQELALRGIGRRGLDAAKTVGNERHNADASFGR